MSGRKRPVLYVIRGPDGVYVGETINPKIRWCQHKLPSTRVGKDLRPLYVSMREHGVEAFTFEVVATCVSFADTGGFSDAAVSLERQIARQLEAQGENVFNSDAEKQRRWIASVIKRYPNSQYAKDHAALARARSASA